MIHRKDLQDRIYILDGAMGTMLQSFCLKEDDFRGMVFANHPVPLKGNYDVLNLTHPEMISSIHQLYVRAGADFITTNTFNSNIFSQRGYGLEKEVSDLAICGAQIARTVADECMEDTGRRVLVVGTLGPTSIPLSLVNDSNRNQVGGADFETMTQAYMLQAKNLLAGGADLLLLETCYDVLTTRAALNAIESLNGEMRATIPVMISVTVDNRTGKTFIGQNLDEFYAGIASYPLLSFGINCSCGILGLGAYIEHLAQNLPCYISFHPNAGLPNSQGKYEVTPDFMAKQMELLARKGCLNIVGGCCGTTPEHISALARAMRGIEPHMVNV